MRQEEGVHASIADLQFDAQGCLLAVANNRGNVRILDFDRFLNHVQNRDLHFKHSVQIDL